MMINFDEKIVLKDVENSINKFINILYSTVSNNGITKV